MDLKSPPVAGPEAEPTRLGQKEKNPEDGENLPEEVELDEPCGMNRLRASSATFIAS